MSPLSNEQHIAQDLLLRYVQDDCSRTEMREIDRHLATCPMCSDAVEGLMLLPDPSVAVAQLDKRIDEKVAGTISEKSVGTPAQQGVEKPILQVIKRPFWQQRWAAAAAVLLLASGSIWVYKGAQNAEKEAVASSEIQAVPNSALENSATATVAASEDTLADTPQYAAAKATQKNKNAIDLKTSGSATTTLSSPQGIAQNAPQSADFDQVIAAKIDSDAKNKKVKTDTEVKNKKAETSNKPNTDLVEIAPATYKTGKPKISADTTTQYTATDRARDYAVTSAQNNSPRPSEQEATKLKDVATVKSEEKKQASTDKYKENVIVAAERKAEKKQEAAMPVKKAAPMSASAAKKSRSEPVIVTPTASGVTTGAHPSSGYSTPTTDYDQVFSRAESFFKQKNYDVAAKEYALFVSLNTSGDRPEYALFQLANCYLKLNRKADAKAIFEKLSATNGPYQSAAKKALKSL
jgi:hypothetical protein